MKLQILSGDIESIKRIAFTDPPYKSIDFVYKLISFIHIYIYIYIYIYICVYIYIYNIYVVMW